MSFEVATVLQRAFIILSKALDSLFLNHRNLRPLDSEDVFCQLSLKNS